MLSWRCGFLIEMDVLHEPSPQGSAATSISDLNLWNQPPGKRVCLVRVHEKGCGRCAPLRSHRSARVFVSSPAGCCRAKVESYPWFYIYIFLFQRPNLMGMVIWILRFWYLGHSRFRLFVTSSAPKLILRENHGVCVWFC